MATKGKSEIKNESNQELKFTKQFSSQLILLAIIYIFFYLMGIINLIGKLLEFIFIFFDKITFILVFILLYTICITISYILIKKALGKPISNNKESKKSQNEILLRVIVAFMLIIIFYKIKLGLLMSHLISLFINFLIKSKFFFKYFVSLEICYDLFMRLI